jgi:iron uptake system EfeUOB component EfeO/EfeM
MRTGEGRAPRRGRIAAAARVAAVAGLALAAAGCGSSGAAKPTTTAPAKRYAYFNFEAPHVASSYSTYALGPSQQPPHPAPTVPLTTTAALAKPIASYRRYAGGRLAAARRDAAALTLALQAGSRAGAEQAWRATYSDYLELGAVYLTGALAELNRRIDGTPGGLPGGVASPRFTGLHRIEHGLWTGAAPASLAPVGAQLQRDLATMAAKLPHAQLTPLEYTLRAHEILEDAQRDQLSGTDVPASGEGVLGTEAGLTATEHVIATMYLLLHPGQDDEEVAIGPRIETELAALRAVFTAIERAHGGRLPANQALGRSESEALQGALGGALEALAQVPPNLETEPAPKPIQIPKSDEKIDP